MPGAAHLRRGVAECSRVLLRGTRPCYRQVSTAPSKY